MTDEIKALEKRIEKLEKKLEKFDEKLVKTKEETKKSFLNAQEKIDKLLGKGGHGLDSGDKIKKLLGR